MWIRAQHDSEEKDQLALLNKEADRLADLGAASAVLFTVPLLALLKGRVLGHVAGRVLLSPAAGVERVYTDRREQAHKRRFALCDFAERPYLWCIDARLNMNLSYTRFQCV